MWRGANGLAVALAALSLQAAGAQEGLPSILYKPDAGPHAFFPLSYRCPPQKNGTVEYIKMSAAGGRIKVRVTFENNAATHASVQRAWRSATFENWHEFANPKEKPQIQADRELLEVILGDAEAVHAAICFGAPGIREKYDKILEYNRQHLKAPPD